MRLSSRSRRAVAAAGVLAAVAACPAAAVAHPGDSDPSFGGGRGFVTTDVVPGAGIVDQAEGVAIGPFGDAYAVGTSFSPAAPSATRSQWPTTTAAAWTARSASEALRP